MKVTMQASGALAIFGCLLLMGYVIPWALAEFSGDHLSPSKSTSQTSRVDPSPEEELIDRIAAAVVVSARKHSLAQSQDLGVSFAMHMRSYLGGAPRQLFEERTKRGDTVVQAAMLHMAEMYVNRGSLDSALNVQTMNSEQLYETLWRAARSEGWRISKVDLESVNVVRHVRVTFHPKSESKTYLSQSSLFNPPGMGVLEFGPVRHEMLESGRAVSIDCEVTFHDGRQGSLFITFALIEDKWRPIGIVYQIFEGDGAWPLPMI